MSWELEAHDDDERVRRNRRSLTPERRRRPLNPRRKYEAQRAVEGSNHDLPQIRALLRDVLKELDRLIVELDEANGWAKFWREQANDYGNVEAALDAARAEADRLREALEHIERSATLIGLTEIAKIAREALAGSGGDTPT